MDALQVYCLEQMLARSHSTLRPEAAWVEFVNDPVPVRFRVLPSQEIYELLTDAQASRVSGLIGDPGPGKGYYGRHAYEEWRRRRPCACGLKECLQSTDSVLFHCGLCTEARALLRNGMSTFASSCDPAYVQARGWQTAVALLRGEPSPAAPPNTLQLDVFCLACRIKGLWRGAGEPAFKGE